MLGMPKLVQQWKQVCCVILEVRCVVADEGYSWAMGAVGRNGRNEMSFGHFDGIFLEIWGHWMGSYKLPRRKSL